MAFTANNQNAGMVAMCFFDEKMQVLEVVVVAGKASAV